MVKININLSKGIIDLDAEADEVEAATEQALRLMEKLQDIGRFAPKQNNSYSGEQSGNTIDETQVFEKNLAPKDNSEKPKRKRGNSKSRDWQFNPRLLQDEEWAGLKEFFDSKNPNTQNEKVAALCYALNIPTGRPAFDGNEIHSAFRTLGEKTPANLTGVLGNMATLGLGHSSDGKFTLGFKGKQLVEHELPKEKSTAK